MDLSSMTSYDASKVLIQRDTANDKDKCDALYPSNPVFR
jgi:hypothetical protein